jgi:ABC-2 type transport system ATP-binding protein
MIEVEDLTIRYDELVAVRSVSLEVEDGSVFGLIGPNGAGKTSMIRALAGLLPPAAGRCSVNDIDVQQDPVAVHRLIGYMPDFFGVYDHLLVREYLEFFGQLYGLPPESLRKRVDEVLSTAELTEKAEAAAGGLSRGMKQRLCLARCLVHDPQVLLLDEPLSGVDPRGRFGLRRLIYRLGEMGKTVLVSSHILPELSDVCDSVGIIEKGDLLACGPVDRIAAELGAARVLRIKIMDGRADKVPEALQGFAALHECVVEGDIVQLRLADQDEAVAETLRILVANGIRIGSITEERTDLEQLFLRLTQGELA